MKRIIFTLILLVSTPMMILIGGCLDNDVGATDLRTITLYGFSVKGEVFENEIIPLFKTHWKEVTGEDIGFTTNYAGSGSITNQVITGAPAEVMVLSTEWDAMKLQSQGLVTTDWRTYPNNGTISMSPFTIMTRSSNPKDIHDFKDLSKNNIELVHADPSTSGGACWSIFAIYGSELRKTGSTENASKILGGVVDNVISWQSSARKALSQFSLGFGDAFITYENDALLCINDGYDFEVIYPGSTILSEHKAVLVDENIDDCERDLIESFLDFLFTPQVQELFVEYNFRSIDPDLNGCFPIIEDPFTVEYLGGWEQAHDILIDELFADIRG